MRKVRDNGEIFRLYKLEIIFFAFLIPMYLRRVNSQITVDTWNRVLKKHTCQSEIYVKISLQFENDIGKHH